MGIEHVFVFEPFNFQVGHKIHIVSGPLKGDWEIIGLTEKKVVLRCPVTFKVLEKDRFCFFVEERQQEWPMV